MSEESTYRCPSWDEPITRDEIRSIEADYGPLASNLAELAQLIREMDRCAPRIFYKNEIWVMVEPSPGAAAFRYLEEEDIGPIYDGDGNLVDYPFVGFITCQSQETIGFLIRILASARKLRPVLQTVIGEDSARDFYIDLQLNLEYEYHELGTGLRPRAGRRWRGVHGGVKRLAGRVEHWQSILVNLMKEERQPSVSGYVEIDYTQRTLTIGKVVIRPSDRVWNFLKELADVKRHNSPDLRREEWKNALDMLRRKVGKTNLQFVVDLNGPGYRLAQNVNLKGFSQERIHRTG